MDYLLKASGIIAIFYLFYLLFLRKDTFYSANRIYLILGLLLTFLVPLVVIPIYVERAAIDMSSFVIDMNSAQIIEETAPALSLNDYLMFAYLCGVVVCFTRFILQLVALVKIIVRNKKERYGNFIYVTTPEKVPPFSFFNWIVYNPNTFSKIELDQVITHEKAHADQNHSFDVLLTQIACIVFWFNPIIWFYSKSLKQNLEFLADKSAVSTTSCKKTYQYTLLKTGIAHQQLVLGNTFYNSLIKKRIVMLHKSKSKKTSQLKFLLILPFLGLFLMSFNTEERYIYKESAVTYVTPELDLIEETVPFITETNSSKRQKITNSSHKTSFSKTTSKGEIPSVKQVEAISKQNNGEVIIVTKNTSDTELDDLVTSQKENGLTLKFSGLKRNDDGAIIAIKIEASTKSSNANYSISNTDAIQPIMIKYDSKGSVSIGNTEATNKFILSSDKNKVIEVITEVIKDENGEDKEVEEDVIIIREQDKNHKENDVLIFRQGDSIIDKKDLKFKKTKSKIIIRDVEDGSEPLLIVNGKELKRSKMDDISPEEIESISVLKGESGTAIFGDRAKDGVVLISTKKPLVLEMNNQSEKNSIIIEEENETTDLKGNAKFKLKNNKALIFIDGKESSKKKMKKLKPEDITHVKVLKGKSAIEKYGEKGKEGVIEITTSK
ncbi:MAG: M56 family metallopeptidase [Jejuia sp.]